MHLLEQREVGMFLLQVMEQLATLHQQAHAFPLGKQLLQYAARDAATGRLDGHQQLRSANALDHLVSYEPTGLVLGQRSSHGSLQDLLDLRAQDAAWSGQGRVSDTDRGNRSAHRHVSTVTHRGSAQSEKGLAPSVATRNTNSPPTPAWESVRIIEGVQSIDRQMSAG